MSWYETEPESCDPGRLRDDEERDEPSMCDECRSDARFPITLAGLGTFCSAGCADAASVKHEAAMTPYQLKETA